MQLPHSTAAAAAAAAVRIARRNSRLVRVASTQQGAGVAGSFVSSMIKVSAAESPCLAESLVQRFEAACRCLHEVHSGAAAIIRSRHTYE